LRSVVAPAVVAPGEDCRFGHFGLPHAILLQLGIGLITLVLYSAFVYSNKAGTQGNRTTLPKKNPHFRLAASTVMR
jgi:hypothetical protein